MGTETFVFRQVGTTGCEIVGPDGVIAWTVDAVCAAVIVGLLNHAEPGSPGMRQGASGSTRGTQILPPRRVPKRRTPKRPPARRSRI